MRYVQLVLLLAVVNLLAGCKAEIVADVYTDDIFDVETLSTPAVMKVEIASCRSKKRAEYDEKILDLFDTAAEARVIGCTRKGGKSMLTVGFIAQITSGASSADFILYREKTESDEFVTQAIKPGFSMNFLQRVDSTLKQNFQRLKSSDLRVAVVLNNDLSDDVLISARNVWINGDPMESYSNVPLKRRERLVLTMPDIMSDLILRNRKPVVFKASRRK